MPTYFGQQSSYQADYAASGQGTTEWNSPSGAPFTCPGSGPQVVKEISGYVNPSGQGAWFRLAVYNNAGNALIAQGAAKMQAVYTSNVHTWQGHTDPTQITPNPATLTGGVNYIIAATAYYYNTSSGMNLGYANYSTYGWVAAAYRTYYTDSGFPASLPSGSAANGIPMLRCGVDPPPTATLTYTAGTGGSISGTDPQTVNIGSNGSPVVAVPNTGYHFVNWSDSRTDNPRTDNNVQGNITVTANFAINQYTLSYAAGANGSIGGSTPQTVNYGGSGTAVMAVPNSGYYFVNWSDASVVNPRTDSGVTGNISVTANFAQIVGSGSLAATLGGATDSGAAVVLIQAALSKILDAVTEAGAGNLLVKGQVVQALADALLTSGGQLTPLAMQLADAVLSSTGTVDIKGSAAAQLADILTAAATQGLLNGSASIPLDGVTASITAALRVKSILSQVLSDVFLASSGKAIHTALLAQTLGGIVIASRLVGWRSVVQTFQGREI